MKNDKDKPIPLLDRMSQESAVVFYNEDGTVALDVDQGRIVGGKDSAIDEIEEKE